MLNRNTKLLVLAILIAIFACGILATAQETESISADYPLPLPRVVKDRPLVLGLNVASLTAESSQRNYHHLKNEAEKRGWKLVENVDALTVDLQRAGLENLINQDVDAIILWYNIMEGIKDLVLKAREKGIGFYCVDTELRDGVLVNPTQGNGVVGAQMVYYGLGRLKEVGNVLILNSPGHILRQRCYAAKGLIENEWPNLKLAGFENLKDPGWEKDAYDVTQNYLTRFDNDIQWLYGGFDMPAIFGSKAIEEAGLTRDECFATGIDGGTQAYAEIRKGNPFTATMSQPFEQYTHLACEAIHQTQIEGIVPGSPESIIPAQTRTVYVLPVLTTPENVPAPGTNIHELFLDTYYNPEEEDAWYTWGTPYKVQ